MIIILNVLYNNEYFIERIDKMIFNNTVYESYLGKPKEFLFIENELQSIIDMINEYQSDITKLQNNIYNTKHINNVEKTLAKFFKFKNVILNFYTGLPSFVYDLTDNLVASEYRPMNATTNPYTFTFIYGFKKGWNTVNMMDNMMVSISIDVLYIYYNKLTASELMAVILHEIGHNLDTSIFSFISSLDSIVSADNLEDMFKSAFAALIVDYLDLPKYLTLIIKHINTFLANNFPILSKVIGEVTLVSEKWYEPLMKMYNITNIGSIFSNMNFINNLLNPFKISSRYSEKIADDYAIKYGYGAEIQSTRKKMDLNYKNNMIERNIYEIKGLNWAYDLMTLSLLKMQLATSSHPSNISRMYNVIDVLEYESKDPNLNPKLKKQLEVELENARDFMKKFTDASEDHNKQKVFTWLHNYIHINIFKNMIDTTSIVDLFYKNIKKL
jgi:Zn-dependent protease with chaperone function